MTSSKRQRSKALLFFITSFAWPFKAEAITATKSHVARDAFVVDAPTPPSKIIHNATLLPCWVGFQAKLAATAFALRDIVSGSILPALATEAGYVPGLEGDPLAESKSQWVCLNECFKQNDFGVSVMFYQKGVCSETGFEDNTCFLFLWLNKH